MQQSSSEQKQLNPLILIIASDVHTIKLFRLGLQIEGYKVAGYQYGPEILEDVKKVPPHLIILELSDSESDGFKLFKKLREEGVTQNCPIFVLMEKPDAQIDQEIDANAVIPRPFDFDDVVEQVNAIIGHLNPQLSRPRRGFLFPVDNPPPDLPRHL